MSPRAAPLDERVREMFLTLISRHLNELSGFVRRELTHHQALGDLFPGEVRPEEVVDAVLVRAQREFADNPTAREIKRSQLIRLAIEEIKAEITRSRLERTRGVHIEEDVPETPPTEQVSTLGDEVLDFYISEEDLKVEEVIPDLEAPTPEQELERQALRECVQDAMADMPTEWRQALRLRYIDGIEAAELARTMGTSRMEAERRIDHARRYLRQRLVESGYRFKAH